MGTERHSQVFHPLGHLHDVVFHHGSVHHQGGGRLGGEGGSVHDAGQS